MIGALYSGLTGLKTHQTKVNIIGNNLSGMSFVYNFQYNSFVRFWT